MRVLSTILALGLVVTAPAAGQGKPDEGIQAGNYNIRQAIEFGGRWTGISGNGAVYNTFVNLNSGIRLFEHSLEMRSLNHAGAVFDDFSMSSFGYGGDPNDVTRLRVYKNRWYNFSGMFRRDRNLWDYNLLANPVNPVASSPSVPITFSPHRFETSRRMSDFDLTLLPQSRVRFRAGYSRNISDGPSLSTIHEGTDTVIFQGWKTTLNSYHLGADFKLLPRTNVSYDQFLHYYKGDTSWVDTRFGYQLSTGTPTDLGIVFNTTAGQPCSAPVTNPGTTPPTANPACNLFLGYTRSAPLRNSYPTEQFSFQSNYFRNLDLAGRFVYSASDATASVYNELFQGLLTRTLQRQIQDSGPAAARRVSVTVDMGATWHFTPKFRVSDAFRYTAFRIPGQWNGKETSLFGTPSAHNTSSPADSITEIFSEFLGQHFGQNQLDFHYDFNKRVSGHLGYRYTRRQIKLSDVEAITQLFLAPLPNRGACAGKPLSADGSCQVTVPTGDASQTIINQHAGLLGISARPTDALRLNFDLELLAADNTFTRIAPRQLQHYQFRGSYRPSPGVILGGSLNVLENRNNAAEIGNLQHNRGYAFNAVVARGERWGLDAGYQYNDVFSRTNICFVSTPAPAGASPCPAAIALLQEFSFYNSTTHFGYGGVTWKPLPRVTAAAGYTITHVDGSTLILNPNSPLGPLQSSFHKPTANLAVDLAKGLTWKAGWGYYDYNEPSPADQTGQRNFRGNLLNFSLRYAF